MIKRIVKMTFRKEAVPEFLQIFQEAKRQIRTFEGCCHLELVQSIDKPNVLFTISHWKSEDALDNYRQSDLFQNTWKKTKALFSKRPRAWSVKVVADCNS